MAFDLNKARQEVAQTGADLTKPSTGGGDFAPPAEGATRLRLVGYVETGVHKTMFQGNPKIKPRSELTFELSGPKHEPKDTDAGKIPFRITVKEVIGTHQKNGYIKLFNILNSDGDAKNFMDLLRDKAWRGTVSHFKFKGTDGKDRVVAQLKKDGAYQISPVSFEDPESGELRTVSVPPAISPLRVFLWDYADLDQWDSLLDFQKDKIRTAENFEGSPIYNLLVEAGRDAELALSERGAQEQAKEEAEEPPEDAGEKQVEPKASTPGKNGHAPLPATPPPAAAGKAPASPAKAPKAPAKAKVAAEPTDPLQGL